MQQGPAGKSSKPDLVLLEGSFVALTMAHFLYFWCFHWMIIETIHIGKRTLSFAYLSATQFCNPRSDPLNFLCLDYLD